MSHFPEHLRAAIRAAAVEPHHLPHEIDDGPKCADCHGWGGSDCPDCDGDGDISCECDGHDKSCLDCFGSGVRFCEDCDGRGQEDCSACCGFGSSARLWVAQEAERLWQRDILRDVMAGDRKLYIGFAWSTWQDEHPTAGTSPNQIPFPFAEAA